MNFPVLPVAASTSAQHTDAVFYSLVGLSLMVMVIVFGPMIFILFRYRRSQNVNRRIGYVPENAIEVTWMTVPFLIMLCFWGWAGVDYFDEERPPENAIQIDVVGKQWMWKLEHAEGNAEINQLHIPLNRPVKLTLASQDVIHSFFVPAFRVKQDVVPGRYTSEWFTPIKAGTYHIFCSQYCGTGHAAMIGEAIVMEPADYQRWLAQSSPGETMAQRGARLFRDFGCSGCHMGNSVVRAPRLEGIFGKPVPLQDGRVVLADETYLHDCILQPTVRVPAGYAPVMPSFQGQVSEEQLFQLIAYIKSLASTQVEGPTP